MLLDGVTLIATPRYTHVTRGSSTEHPNAIDFGWNGNGTQNQPLYSGVYGAIECKVARKRFIDGGSGSGATGHVIDIQFETPNYTCYRSSMHMATESPLAIGTVLQWDSVIGTMGSTGDSTGPHDHVILAICPKGTPVSEMYNYRVEPDSYYHYVNDWHIADDKLPWVTLDDTPSTTPGDEIQSLVLRHMGDLKMGFLIIRGAWSKLVEKPNTVTMPATIDKVNVWRSNKVVGQLLPKKLGGLTYDVIKVSSGNGDLTIKTRDFGEVVVYPDTRFIYN